MYSISKSNPSEGDQTVLWLTAAAPCDEDTYLVVGTERAGPRSSATHNRTGFSLVKVLSLHLNLATSASKPENPSDMMHKCIRMHINDHKFFVFDPTSAT